MTKELMLMDSLKNTDSIKAINQYISYVKSKGGDTTRHNALVLTQGEGYPVSTYIGIIQGENYTVIIENISNEFVTNSFKSNEYVFEYRPTNTLIIKISNNTSNNSEIDITYID